MGYIATAIPCPGNSDDDQTIRSRRICCVKFKAKTSWKDLEAITTKNGPAATSAVCVDCGTNKFRIGVLS